MDVYPRVSTVYGPVHSWRVGLSLGIDLICETSVCSFNCTYCQLGNIVRHTGERKIFVPTSKVIEDLKASRWREADIITFSGSGEPTLALNIGECIREIRALTAKPTLVLTNGILLADPQVRRDLAESDRVYVKIDAADQEVFERINRPVEGVSLQGIVAATVQFRKDHEVSKWKLKDPIARFRSYLEQRGLWNEKKNEALEKEIKREIAELLHRVEKEGVPPLESIFECVFAEMTPQLREQLEEARRAREKH